MTFYKWMQRRESGFRPTYGDEDFLMKRIYNSLNVLKTWNGFNETSPDTSEYGAVFNLEFSPEGNLLVAACQKKSIALFDTISREQTGKIHKAHSDNVNCVKFLDSRMFATCSDDTTVALWDIRNLKTKIRSLHGHSNWVKNVEYSAKDGLLVTSGFDGSIYTWDINSYTEQGLIYQKIFNTSGLMRCRLSPDASKLVICTTGGYLIIIHNLDLNTMHKDLCGFRPNIYRLMQLGRQYIPQAAKFDHVFSKEQKKNRVEIVSDFPVDNDAEVILALQIHPQGWCCLTRNISYDEGSEWSCIHDIQQLPDKGTECVSTTSRKRKYVDEVRRPDSTRVRRVEITSTLTPETAGTSSNANVVNNLNRRMNATTARSESFVPDIWAAEVTVQDRACRTVRGSRGTNNNAFAYVYAISSGVLPTSGSNSRTNALRNRISDVGGIEPFNELPPASEVSQPNFIPQSSTASSKSNVADHYNNAHRLLYYARESNTGKGYIKEPSFSSDGRIVCSPYDSGVRLFAFANECSDLPDALHSTRQIPDQLKEIKTIVSHSDMVVCTKFSPRLPLLVTGCLGGKIVWHHPEF